MRIVFAGTPQFAAVSLRALFATGHSVTGVLTQPDRPAGRGRKPRRSEVKEVALAAELEIAQPASLRDAGARDWLRAQAPDVIVVAAYGLILPTEVLALPEHGCINVHASLLPRWRGAAPIQRAILAGDRRSGVCIMQMEAGLDTGPLLRCVPEALRDDDTAGTLHDRLATLGAHALLASLDDLVSGKLDPHAQAAEGITYAARIDKAEARIDWHRPSIEINRQVRAFNPWPMAFTTLPDGRRLRVLEACAADAAEVGNDAPVQPGTVAGTQWPCVATGDGWMRLVRVQLAGGKALAGDALRRGLEMHRLG